MRIITWNLWVSNRHAKKAIDHALSFDPDVICFQELSAPMLEYLKQNKYTATYTYDSVNHRNTKKTAYICTLTKEKPKRARVVEYSQVRSTSFLSRVIYEKIIRSNEKHEAPIVEIAAGNTHVQIANARLSCAVGTRERLSEFTGILSQLNPNIPAVIAGDFNIIDNQLINILIGWIRGFRLREYFLNERREFEKIVQAHGYTNIFRKRTTYITSHPVLQLDHILVPRDARISYHHIEKKRFGSDHRMLIADIDFTG